MGEPLKLDGKMLELAQMVNRNYQGADNDKEKLLENKGEIRMFKEQASLYNLDKAQVEAVLGHEEVKSVMGDDWSTLMGFEKSGETQTTTNPGRAEQSSNLTYKVVTEADQKRAQKTVIDKLVNVASPSTAPNDSKMLEDLTKSLGVLADNAYYKELVQDVKDMVAQLPAYSAETGYGSKETVDGIHGTLKKYLKSNNKWDSFHQAALKKLEQMAEDVQRNLEHKQIENDFKNELETKGATLEAAYDTVKAKYKDKGSYFKDEVKKYENKEVMEEARKQVRAKIYEIIEEKSKEEMHIGDDEIESKEIKTLVESKLKESGLWNKYTKKALGGENNFSEWISGKDSDMKVARKNAARNITVKRIANTPQKKEDILKSLGEKNQLFDEMIAAGLIIPRGNETYDISPLSELIGLNVGSNAKKDRQIKAFQALSEGTKATSALSVAAQLKDFNEKQADDLIELCGYEIQGKNWGKAILGATVGALTSAANSAIVAATNPNPTQIIQYQKNVKTHVEVNNSVVSDIGTLQSDIDSTCGSGYANIIQSGTNVIIDIVNPITPLFIYTAAKHVALSALKGSIYGAALGLIAGLKDSPEKPITSTQFECTDLESYKARLANEAKNNKVKQEYVDALLMIAATFVDKDGNWDCEAYKMELNRAAGDGGVLNREELIGLLTKKSGKKEEPKPNPNPTPTPTPAPEKKFGQYSECDIKTITNYDVPTIDGKKTGWEAIAKQYDCLVEKYGLKMTIRILKIAQGILDGDFSEERLVRLAKASFQKDLDTLKDEPNFNYNTYRNVLKATYLDKVMVPDNLAGCDRDKNVSLEYKPSKMAAKAVKPGTVDNKYQEVDTYTLYTTTGSDKDDTYAGFDKNEYDKRRQKWAEDGRDVTNTGCK